MLGTSSCCATAALTGPVRAAREPNDDLQYTLHEHWHSNIFSRTSGYVPQLQSYLFRLSISHVLLPLNR